MSLAHNGHSQLSDSNTGEARTTWKWAASRRSAARSSQEMNRLGMMVDVSHPSKGSMLQALGLSKAPIIASHSAVRALANQSRNMDDEMLMALEDQWRRRADRRLRGLHQGAIPERAPAIAGAAAGVRIVAGGRRRRRGTRRRAGRRRRSRRSGRARCRTLAARGAVLQTPARRSPRGVRAPHGGRSTGKWPATPVAPPSRTSSTTSTTR